MAKVKDVIKLIEDIAPPSLAVEGDPIGLCIGDHLSEVSTVLLCLDVTEDAVAYANKIGAGLIVSHHPLIYNRVSCILNNDPIQRTIAQAIRFGVSVYAAHTNLDNADKGINDYLMSIAKGKKKEALAVDGGRVGLVFAIEPTPLVELAALYGAAIKDRTYASGEGIVSRLAVISGGGGGDVSHLIAAQKLGAQCILTGDVKHHFYKYAQGINMCVIEASHFAVEYGYMPVFKTLIQEQAKKSKLPLMVEIYNESNTRRLI